MRDHSTTAAGTTSKGKRIKRQQHGGGQGDGQSRIPHPTMRDHHVFRWLRAGIRSPIPIGPGIFRKLAEPIRSS